MARTIWTWKARAAARLDRALADAIESGEGQWLGEAREVSRSQIQRLIEKGCVRVEGSVAKANSKLREAAFVEIEFPKPEPISLIPEERPLEILYQDEHLLVVNKPPGLTVHPSATQRTGTLVHALLHHVKDLSGIGGELRPGIVHRIDKDTSGALVITKSDRAHHKLAEVFFRHAIERVYWAYCYGAPPAEGRIEGRIGRNPSDRKKMAVVETGGRDAATFFRRQEEFGTGQGKPFASWLEVRLETGRTHQIRVHLTSIGHSLLGDPVYGTPTNGQAKWKGLPLDVQSAVRALPGQALHARVLGFEHPITGKPLRFEAKLPPELAKLVEILGKYR